MQDTQFMTAAEKGLVLRQWEKFLKSGLAREKFTKALYHHLIQHCSFIAHYNIEGFFDTYFTSGCDKASFLSQFDNRHGIPSSIEYGGVHWYTQPDYNDINSAMCQVAAKYLPQLIQDVNATQKLYDIQAARVDLTFESV